MKSDMEQRAVQALRRTWDVIGSDALAVDGDQETVEWTAYDVRDMVSSCGFLGGYPEWYGQDKEAVQWLNGLDDNNQDRILREAFPPGRYGM